MPARNAAIDRSRTALTILVVTHHAVIPYTYYGRADAQTWLGFDGFILATDTCMMTAFFFISGLFVWPSLRRKSILQFLDERMLRLALPFAVAVLTLMPLAYYALELRMHDISFSAYWWRTITAGPWQSGPAWFVWVLLALDLTAALLYRTAPNILAPLNRLARAGFTQPLPFFLAFVAACLVAYVPMRLAFDATRWFEFGPISIQASRALLYPTCFFFGAAIGYSDLNRGLLGHDGALAQRWGCWALAALAAYGLLVALVYYRRGILPDPNVLPEWWQIAYAFVFVLLSATASFAILGGFIRLSAAAMPLLDAMQPAAYGIYLIHYVPVLWMQYWLWGTDHSAFTKAGLSLAFGLGASWLTTAALRRLPGATRVL